MDRPEARIAERMPYAVAIEFRTASSFLVAYSVNLSRGGLFVETEAVIPSGSAVTVDLAIPGAGAVSLNGIIAWCRGAESTEGAPGLGVEFEDVAPLLGAVIDELVGSFRSINVLVLATDKHDRSALARSIKSIIATADVTQADTASTAKALVGAENDLILVDLDVDPEGGLGILRAAKEQVPPVPTIALTANVKLREHARAAGADELVANPPPFAELQVALFRALAKPASVRSAGPAR